MTARKYHKLAVNESMETMQNVIFFDTESRVDTMKVHHPYAVAAIFSRLDGNTRRECEYWHDRIYDFWNDVDSFCQAKTRTYLFAHNAAYDFLVLSGMENLLARGWRAVSLFERGPVFILKLRSGNRTLVVLSTTNYFAGSLKQLAKAIGMEKIDIDVLNAPEAEIRPYMKQDVRIIERAVLIFLAFVRDNDLGNVAMTLAGQAFNAFRHRFMHHDIMIHDNADVLKLERDAYIGGRVECFYQGELPDAYAPYHKLDVNSLYPDRMYKKDVPIRLLWHRKHGDLRGLLVRARAKGILCIARVTLSTDVNMYPALVGKRMVYPTGTFDTTLCTEKLDGALQLGHIVAVHEIAGYHGEKVFTEYVEFFYGRKMNETNPVLRYFYKLFMNALYGKFGQLAHPCVRVSDADPYEISCETIYHMPSRTHRTRRTFGGGVFDETVSNDPVEREAYNSFPAIAAHITDYASSKLFSYIDEANAEHVYYVDTDSVIVDDVGYHALLQHVDDKQLGALKYEGHSEPGDSITQPKEYTFGGEHKMKGISKGAVLIADRMWDTTQWPKFSGMIHKGNLSGYHNVTRTKRLSMEYKKGVVSANGRIEPYRVE